MKSVRTRSFSGPYSINNETTYFDFIVNLTTLGGLGHCFVKVCPVSFFCNIITPNTVIYSLLFLEQYVSLIIYLFIYLFICFSLFKVGLHVINNCLTNKNQRSKKCKILGTGARSDL